MKEADEDNKGRSEARPPTGLEDLRVNVKYKLSGLWAAVMFIFIYVDHLALFIPGLLEDIITGDFPLGSQGMLWAAMVMMTIPALMIFLSLELRADINRRLNIVVGVVYFIIVLSNTVGETWAFYAFGSLVEAGLLFLIIWNAWNWPVREIAARK